MPVDLGFSNDDRYAVVLHDFEYQPFIELGIVARQGLADWKFLQLTYPEVLPLHSTANGTQKPVVPYPADWVEYDLALNPGNEGAVFGAHNYRNNDGREVGFDWKDLSTYKDKSMKIEPVTTGGNIVRVKRVTGKGALIEAFTRYDAAPDSAKVNHFTHPHLIQQFTAITPSGELRGFGDEKFPLYFPLITKSPEAYIKLDRLRFLPADYDIFSHVVLPSSGVIASPVNKDMFTNQTMVNVFYQAAAFYGQDGWEWIKEAGMQVMTVPEENRKRGYFESGLPVVGEINLPEWKWRALQAVIEGNPLPQPDKPIPDLPKPKPTLPSDSFNATAIEDGVRVRTHETFRSNAKGFPIFLPSGAKKKGQELRLHTGSRVLLDRVGVLGDGDKSFRWHKILSVDPGAVIEEKGATAEKAIGQYLRGRDRIDWD